MLEKRKIFLWSCIVGAAGLGSSLWGLRTGQKCIRRTLTKKISKFVCKDGPHEVPS